MIVIRDYRYIGDNDENSFIAGRFKNMIDAWYMIQSVLTSYHMFTKSIVFHWATNNIVVSKQNVRVHDQERWCQTLMTGLCTSNCKI